MDSWAIVDGVLKKNLSKEEIDKIPKGKYIKIKQGRIKGMIFESWWTDLEKETAIDFSYMTFRTDIMNARQEFFKMHGIKPICLKSYILPPENFTEEGVRLPNE